MLYIVVKVGTHIYMVGNKCTWFWSE